MLLSKWNCIKTTVKDVLNKILVRNSVAMIEEENIKIDFSKMRCEGY